MALHSTPLLMPEGPPPMLGGVDVLLLEARNAMSGGGAKPESVFGGMNVLVSHSVDESDRRALWSLRHALAFGQTTHYTGADWPEWLAERAVVTQPEFVSAVIFAGAGEFVFAKTAESVRAALRRQLPSPPAAVVLVGDGDTSPTVCGMTGIVQSASKTTAETARQVFFSLAAFLAPATFSGIDLLDLLPVFNPARAPTRLADALWVCDGDQLIFATDADRDAVAAARYIVATPLADRPSWADLRQLRQCLRRAASQSATVILFAAEGMRCPGSMPNTVARVPILCL